MKRSNIFKLIAAATALAASSASLAATVLVVRAAGPSAKMYPRGKALPDSAKIQLQPGDTVMLLKPDGTRTLRGPGTFALAAVTSGGANAINRRARFSALRSGAVRLNPSPWNLDVTQSGKLCVVSASKLNLWRPEAEAAAQLTVKGGGVEETIEFPAGKDTIAWPASLPVTSGAEYQLSHPETGDSARVTFVTVSNPPQDAVGTAQTLIANGCENQLDVLVEATPSMD